MQAWAPCPDPVVMFSPAIVELYSLKEQNGIETGEEERELHPEMVQQRRVLSWGQVELASRSYSGSGRWRNLKYHHTGVL